MATDPATPAAALRERPRGTTPEARRRTLSYEMLRRVGDPRTLLFVWLATAALVATGLDGIAVGALLYGWLGVVATVAFAGARALLRRRRSVLARRLAAVGRELPPGPVVDDARALTGALARGEVPDADLAQIEARVDYLVERAARGGVVPGLSPMPRPPGPE